MITAIYKIKNVEYRILFCRVGVDVSSMVMERRANICTIAQKSLRMLQVGSPPSDTRWDKMALTSARCSKCGTSLLTLSLRCLARTLTRWTLSHNGCTEPPRLKLIFGDFEPLLYCLSSSSVALLGPGWSSLYSSKCRNNSGKLRASLGESRGLHPYLSVLR